MQLQFPFQISSRLLPAVRVGNDWVSIKLGWIYPKGRQAYDITIDTHDGKEFSVMDIMSGCQGGSLQEGMASFFSFLSAAIEGKRFQERTGRESDNADLFSPEILEWAEENCGDIEMLACELEETKNLITD
jgi:hypothetical protein